MHQTVTYFPLEYEIHGRVYIFWTIENDKNTNIQTPQRRGLNFARSCKRLSFLKIRHLICIHSIRIFETFVYGIFTILTPGTRKFRIFYNFMHLRKTVHFETFFVAIMGVSCKIKQNSFAWEKIIFYCYYWMIFCISISWGFCFFRL